MLLKEDIVKKYEEYKKLCTQLSADMKESVCYNSRLFPNDFVIDENMSVKWNREEVQRRKQEYKELAITHSTIKANALKEVESMIKEYIQQNFPTITDGKYKKMTSFLQEWDEDEYYCNNGIWVKVDYLVDLAELIVGN